jgi:hypothetical protein
MQHVTKNTAATPPQTKEKRPKAKRNELRK